MVSAVNHADILSRCDQMVNKQAEARRQERQLNRREHSDDAVELKRQKKEAALAERARKAAALVEQQRQAEEKRARKADKKERKKAQLTSVVGKFCADRVRPHQILIHFDSTRRSLPAKDLHHFRQDNQSEEIEAQPHSVDV